MQSLGDLLSSSLGDLHLEDSPKVRGNGALLLGLISARIDRCHCLGPVLRALYLTDWLSVLRS